MGGGIEDSDESEGVIELTRLVPEHGVERVTGVSWTEGDLRSLVMMRNAQLHVSGDGGHVICSALRGTKDVPNWASFYVSCRGGRKNYCKNYAAL